MRKEIRKEDPYAFFTPSLRTRKFNFSCCVFQLRLHEAVEGLDGVYVIADDILVAGAGDTMKDAVADHDVKIKKLLGRCQERNIKLNKQKVAFKQTEVPYIGHLLTSEGIKADPTKIEAVLRMERPTDVTGVQRIMGILLGRDP